MLALAHMHTMHTYTHICVHVCTYAHMHTYMCAYVHIGRQSIVHACTPLEVLLGVLGMCEKYFLLHFSIII